MSDKSALIEAIKNSIRVNGEARDLMLEVLKSYPNITVPKEQIDGSIAALANARQLLEAVPLSEGE